MSQTITTLVLSPSPNSFSPPQLQQAGHALPIPSRQALLNTLDKMVLHQVVTCSEYIES